MSQFDPSCVDVEHFLETLEIANVQDEGDEFRFSCPFPAHVDGDSKPSAYMNTESTQFYCHGCKARGDAVSFSAWVLGITPMAAIKLLREKYQPGYVNPDQRGTVLEVERILAPDTPVSQQAPLDERVLERFEIDWPAAHAAYMEGDGHPATDYMFTRGFAPETLTEWQFGYDELSDRIVFPARDEHNRLVGFKARAHDDRHPKYLVLGDKPGREERYGFAPYLKSRVLYGLHHALELTDPAASDHHRHFILCEGELNAVACWQAGYAAVAINGSTFSDYQHKLLTKHADAVTIFFDSDRAGNEATWGWYDAKKVWHDGVAERLRSWLHVRAVPEHEDDPASMDEDQLADLITQARSVLLHSIA